MIGWIATLLALRSLLLAIFEEKKRAYRWIDFGLFFFFVLVLFTARFQYDPALVMIATALIGMNVVLRIFGFSRRSRLFMTLKGVAFGLFFIICALSIAFSGLQNLTEEKPMLHVRLTGKKSKRWVEWKNPSQDCLSNWVDTYEVVLEQPSGKKVGTFHIYGDLVAVRARVIRFRPLLNFLGISNACQIEALYNGYKDMERHNLLPHLGYPLPLTSPPLAALWKSLFLLKWTSQWIASATLESNYFPLLNDKGEPICASYNVTLHSGGLTAQLVQPH